MTDSNYYWEVIVGKEKFEMTEKEFTFFQAQILKDKTSLIQFEDKMLNPAYFQSAEKRYREPKNSWLADVERTRKMLEQRDEEIRKAKNV